MNSALIQQMLIYFDNVLIFVFLTTAIILIIAYQFWKNRNLPPGPWGLPIVGYLPWLDAKNPYLTLTALSKKYGKVYGLSLGSVYTVVLTDPKIIKKVFSRDSTAGRAPLYLTHGIMNGYGLICSEGDLWKEHRRLTFNYLRQFGATKVGPNRKKMENLILHHCLDFTDHLKTVGENTEIDIFPPLRHSLGSAVNVIIFGKSWDRDDKLWKRLQYFQEVAPKYLGVAGPINFLPFLRFLPKYQNLMDFILKGKEETHIEYQKIINEQSLILDKLNIQNGVTNNATNILQGFLVEKQNKSADVAERLYNDDQFYHLLADLFGASLDTTVTTLRWYFMYLAKYPTIQDEIRKELEDVLQGRPPSMEDLNHLPLTDASILETMRIRPVVPVGIPHGSLEEMEIEGYRIPKGTMLVPLQWALHHDETVWKDPEQFNPRRFINDEGKIEKPEHLMPFQVGKRMCVGNELAGMFLFFFGATLLQNYSITLSDPNVDMWGECGITLTPQDHTFLITPINKNVK